MRRSTRVQARKRVSSNTGNPVHNQRPKRLRGRPSSQSHSELPSEITSVSSDIPENVLARISDIVTQRVTRELGNMLNSPASVQVPFDPQPSIPGASSDTAITPTASLQPTIVPVASSQLQLASVPLGQDLVELPVVPSSTQQATGELENPFISSSLPIDCRVTDKIKQKIWSHAYVDFGSLLANPTAPPRYKVALDSTEGQLTLESADKIRKISNIETWLTAFHVFVGVYTSKFSHDAPALMKYGSLIRDLAARGHNWRFYDENFRFMRQSHVHSMPWSSINTELWLRSQIAPGNNNRSVNNQSQQRRNPFTVPMGFCVNYHKGNRCGPGCRYKHSCYKCSGEHAALNCTFRGSGSDASNPKRPINSQGPRAAKSQQPSNSG